MGILRDRGWRIHLVTDHFPNDAQDISDPAWLKFGLEQGWDALTKDDRILTQVDALELLEQHRRSAFSQGNAQLNIRQQADRFHQHQGKIYRYCRPRHYGFFTCYEADVNKRWPQ